MGELHGLSQGSQRVPCSRYEQGLAYATGVSARHSRKDGKNVLVLLTGDERILSLAKAQGLDFIMGDEKDIPVEYKNAERIEIVAVDGARPLNGQIKRLFIKKRGNQDVPDLRSILRLSVYAARLSNTETQNLSDRTNRFVMAYQMLLQDKIEDIRLFIRAFRGEINDKLILMSFAIPAINKLPINNILQALRLGARMSRMSA